MGSSRGTIHSTGGDPICTRNLAKNTAVNSIGTTRDGVKLSRVSKTLLGASIVPSLVSSLTEGKRAILVEGTADDDADKRTYNSILTGVDVTKIIDDTASDTTIYKQPGTTMYKQTEAQTPYHPQSEDKKGL